MSAPGATSCTTRIGNVDLYAGNYDKTNGAIGDDGPATSARLGSISAVEVDKPRGKVFLLDYGTGKIR
jgi:hypothetical protein